MLTTWRKRDRSNLVHLETCVNEYARSNGGMQCGTLVEPMTRRTYTPELATYDPSQGPLIVVPPAAQTRRSLPSSARRHSSIGALGTSEPRIENASTQPSWLTSKSKVAHALQIQAGQRATAARTAGLGSPARQESDSVRQGMRGAGIDAAMDAAPQPSCDGAGLPASSIGRVGFWQPTSWISVQNATTSRRRCVEPRRRRAPMRLAEPSFLRSRGGGMSVHKQQANQFPTDADCLER